MEIFYLKTFKHVFVIVRICLEKINWICQGIFREVGCEVVHSLLAFVLRCFALLCFALLCFAFLSVAEHTVILQHNIFALTELIIS